MWKLIDSLINITYRQASLIEPIKVDIQEVKRDQYVLQEQDEKPHEEVKALRAQIEAASPATPTRSWAAVAAVASNLVHRLNRQLPDKHWNPIRISTLWLLLVQGDDNYDCDKKTFGQYLPEII